MQVSMRRPRCQWPPGPTRCMFNWQAWFLHCFQERGGTGRQVASVGKPCLASSPRWHWQLPARANKDLLIYNVTRIGLVANLKRMLRRHRVVYRRCTAVM